MYNLYYYPLDPFSRKVRILLGEKNVDFRHVKENFWERRQNFMALNPAGTVPVLENPDTDFVTAGTYAICEYIEEKYTPEKDLVEGGLLGVIPEERAETRRLEEWFDNKFYNEVTKYILNERIYNRFFKNPTPPNPKNIRAAKYNLDIHLDYMEYLLEDRKWLASEMFTLADISAASQISVLDYLGDMDWDVRPRIKEWYSPIKSKIGFRPLLKDKIVGFIPPEWYTQLDF